MPEPTVLTIILNYRTPEMTLEAVEAALREMAGIAGEIIVVDNDSQRRLVRDDRRRRRRRRLGRGSRVRVVAAGRNGGYGAGNNVGIRAGLSGGGRPDYVYILNSDAFPDPGAIRAAGRLPRGTPRRRLRRQLHPRPRRRAARHRLPLPDALERVRGRRARRPDLAAARAPRVPLPIPEARRPVDWLAGASVMMRRSVLDAIGLFDERFFLYFEETDLCRRGRTAGWPTVYVRESEVTHIGSVSTGMKAWTRTPSYWFDSRLRYFVKNHGVAYAAAATVAHVAGGLIWRARMVAPAQAARRSAALPARPRRACLRVPARAARPAPADATAPIATVRQPDRPAARPSESSMSTFSCVVIGNESLVIQCGDMLLERGHAIAALVSAQPRGPRLGRRRGACASRIPGADLAERLGPLSFDWLFSIANLAIVPDAVLAKARRGAINFHDGPLPRYAGLNAPVWALLNREPRHGVTWHMIEGGIDEGDIVEQRLFDLDAGETALTLNTKCYAAAIDSFGALVAALEAGGPRRVPQALDQRTYFGRWARPAAAARLDFRRDAGGAGRPGARPRLRPLLEPARPAEDRRRRPGAAGRRGHGRLQCGRAAPGTVLAVGRRAPGGRHRLRRRGARPAHRHGRRPVRPATVPLVGDGPARARAAEARGADRGDGRARARRGALAPPPRALAPARLPQARAGSRPRRPCPPPARAARRPCRRPPARRRRAPGSRAWAARRRSTSPTPTPPSPPPLRRATSPAGCPSASTPAAETFGDAARPSRPSSPWRAAREPSPSTSSRATRRSPP